MVGLSAVRKGRERRLGRAIRGPGAESHLQKDARVLNAELPLVWEAEWQVLEWMMVHWIA